MSPRLVVLISGQGRNLQAILDAARSGHLGAQVAAVISNRADAAGLERAQAAGVPVEVVDHARYSDRADFDRALADAVARHQPALIALAGFMRVLGHGFLVRFPGQVLNIHPSLLPAFPGIHTHRRALAAGATEHGASVHYVTEELDGGPVVAQGQVPVRAGDTEGQLAERVMREVELKIYPQALAWAARGELSCDGRQAFFRGRALQRPKSMADLEPAFA